MPMSAAYRNAIRDHGQSIITHIGLKNSGGTELSGGSPAYARKPVTWVDNGDGISRPSGDLVFDIAAGSTVASWCGFSALTGGTDYGGEPFASASGPYGAQGTFTLTATTTGITHDAV